MAYTQNKFSVYFLFFFLICQANWSADITNIVIEQRVAMFVCVVVVVGKSIKSRPLFLFFSCGAFMDQPLSKTLFNLMPMEKKSLHPSATIISLQKKLQQSLTQFGMLFYATFTFSVVTSVALFCQSFIKLSIIIFVI